MKQSHPGSLNAPANQRAARSLRRPIRSAQPFVVGDDTNMLLLLLDAGRRVEARGGTGLTGSKHDDSPRNDVGEHGRAAAPGHDQPVRADGGMRGGPGEAAPASGPLAV